MPEQYELDAAAMATIAKSLWGQSVTSGELEHAKDQVASVISNNPRYIDPPLSGEMPQGCI